MRIVVTGRSGQVAQALARSAVPADMELVFLGRPDLDLDRPDSVASAVAAAKPDLVLSIAAYTAVDAAETDRAAAFRANADSPAELARAARSVGAPVFHLSTDYVFDGLKADPYFETDAPGPATVYGASKLAGEQAVLIGQPDSLVLRTAWVHAPWGSNFVRTMLRLAETRGEVSVVADQIGSPTFAPDIAAALLALSRGVLDREGPFGVFHMAGHGATTWAGFAEAVFTGAARRGGPHAAVRPIATEAYPTPAPRPRNSRLDCAALERAWGVKLPHWRTGVVRGLDALLPSGTKEKLH